MEHNIIPEGAETIHRKKKVREFPVPRRYVTTKLSLGGNNDVITELFLPRGSLVSDIPAGDGKLVNLFLRCRDTNSSKNFDIRRVNSNSETPTTAWLQITARMLAKEGTPAIEWIIL
jgi:hypothetical protein